MKYLSKGSASMTVFVNDELLKILTLGNNFYGLRHSLQGSLKQNKYI